MLHICNSKGNILIMMKRVIYSWWKQKEKIMSTVMSKKRCSGGDRPPLLGEMENQLYDKIIEMRIRKMKVTRSYICEQAKIIGTEIPQSLQGNLKYMNQ